MDPIQIDGIGAINIKGAINSEASRMDVSAFGSDMPGAGIYDEACTQARLKTKAKVCALIIMGGEGGNGFSLQVDSMPPEFVLKELPGILHSLADNIMRQGNEMSGSV